MTYLFSNSTGTKISSTQKNRANQGLQAAYLGYSVRTVLQEYGRIQSHCRHRRRRLCGCVGVGANGLAVCTFTTCEIFCDNIVSEWLLSD